jgi:hypothetical protein
VKKPKPLATRLRLVIAMLCDWQIALRDSHMSREPGPNYGKVDEPMAAELRRFDAARETINEAIKLAKEAA